MTRFSSFIAISLVFLVGCTAVGHTEEASPAQAFFANLSREEVDRIGADAKAGNVDAQYVYSLYVINTRHAADDFVRKLTRSAADAGHPAAAFDQCGYDMAADDATSIEACVRAALAGSAYAQALLATFYTLGVYGLKQDPEAAFEWYRHAAFQGEPRSLVQVGNMYRTGRGVAQDDEMAVYYWELGAARDNAEAAMRLGSAYTFGQGVPTNVRLAKKYLMQASDLGDGQAQYTLGAIHQILKDPESAYVMLTLALKRLDAGRIRDAAVKELKQVKAELSAKQMQLAEKSVAAWRKRDPRPEEYIAGTEFTKYLQAALNKRGFDAGDEDGLASAKTISAYKLYASTLHLADVRFDMPDIYYIGYRLNLYGHTSAVQEQPADAKQEAASPPEAVPQDSSGSGFVVDGSGHVVTNAHVAKGCSSLSVIDQGGNKVPARLVKLSASSDLALLQSDLNAAESASFRADDPLKLGEGVVVFGFPLSGTLSERGNLTVGNLTALDGLRDDPSMIQISAPVQPGNSGGPVLDNQGRLVGIVVSKLDAIAVANVTDDIPQNVNFAIKSTVLEDFLRVNSIDYRSGSSDMQELPVTNLAARAQKIAVRVECYGQL